jgi:transposase
MPSGTDLRPVPPAASRPSFSPICRRGPEASGFRGQVWTRKRVAEVMRLECGVLYHPTHAGRLLKTLRWSPPQPMRRARQRHEGAIAQWRDETWPALKKGQRPRPRPFSS